MGRHLSEPEVGVQVGLQDEALVLEAATVQALASILQSVPGMAQASQLVPTGELVAWLEKVGLLLSPWMQEQQRKQFQRQSLASCEHGSMTSHTSNRGDKQSGCGR